MTNLSTFDLIAELTRQLANAKYSDPVSPVHALREMSRFVRSTPDLIEDEKQILTTLTNQLSLAEINRRKT